MTRHFFALLALLSGLAALSGPAHASAVDTLSCASSITASTGEDATSEQIAANAPPTNVSPSTASPAPQHVALRTAVLRQPVLMGIDRAYE